MKIIVAFALVFVIFTGTNAQDSLDATQLKQKVKKYHRMKNSGKTIWTIGSVIALAGIITVVKNTDIYTGIEGSGYKTGEALGIGGVVLIGIGVPLTLIGSIKGEKYRRILIKEIFPGTDSATQQKLLNHEIWIGMTDEMAYYGIGKPKKVTPIPTDDDSQKEKWMYKNRELLFVDKKLASYQTQVRN